MALMTTAEVKSILGITASTYDTQIAFFIPLVEDDLIDYLNNTFSDGYVYRESASAFTFVRGDSDTADYITDTEAEFLEKGFLSDMDIIIQGGGANVGLHTVSSASTDKLLLSEYGILINQEQGDTKDDNYIGSVLITRVKWPNALKMPAAQMIWHLIDDAKASNVQSEKLDDYSVTYKAVAMAGSNAYPVEILDRLNKWRRPEFR
jgi:hypothetical protein